MRRIQYSLRGVTRRTDGLLRQRARETGVSLNQAALAALQRGLGMDQEPQRFDDLDDLAGTWVADPAMEQAFADMDRVDEAIWQ